MTEHVGRSALPYHLVEADALRRLIDFSGLLMVRVNTAGIIKYVSPAALSVLRVELDSVLGAEVLTFIAPEDMAEFRAAWAKIPHNLDRPWLTTLVAANGARVRVLWNARITSLADTSYEIHAIGRPLDGPSAGWRNFADAYHQRFNKSGRPDSEVAPGASPVAADDLSMMLQIVSRGEEMGQSGSWIGYLPDGGFVFSDGIFRLAGLPVPRPGESRHLPVEEWIHPDDLGWFTERLYPSYVSPAEFDITVRCVRKDGAIRHVHATGRSYKQYPSDLTPTRVNGVMRDITDEIIPIRALRTLERGVLALVGATDEKQLLADVCATITEEGSYRHSGYRRASDLAVIATSGDSRWIESEIELQARRVIETGKQITLPDDNFDKSQPAALFVPVMVEGKLDGVLAVWSEEAAAFTGTAAGHLGTLAIQIGEKLGGLRRRARLTEDEQNRLWPK